MASVSSSTIFSNSYDNVKDIINNNVTDPKTGNTASTRRWIYKFFPRVKSISDHGYPFIVLKTPVTEDSPVTLDRSLIEDNFMFTCEIYTDYNENAVVPGSTVIDPSDRTDTIANKIVETFRLSSVLSTLSTNELHAPRISSSPIDIVLDNKRLIGTSLQLKFSSQTTQS